MSGIILNLIFGEQSFITHRFKLEDYKKAFRKMIDNPPGMVKIVLDCKG